MTGQLDWHADWVLWSGSFWPEWVNYWTPVGLPFEVAMIVYLWRMIEWNQRTERR